MKRHPQNVEQRWQQQVGRFGNLLYLSVMTAAFNLLISGLVLIGIMMWFHTPALDLKYGSKNRKQ